MPILRIFQHSSDESHHTVDISFEELPPLSTHFEFQLSKEDEQDLRWYLEDYLQYPLDPNPEIAERVEARMRAIGEELFKKIFDSEAIKGYWKMIQPKISQSRLEIITDVRDAVSMPWELLRDPESGVPFALRAQAFVRGQRNPAVLPSVLYEKPEKVRILLVICRPDAGEDVPFRSVAGKLVKGLDEQARGRFELDVLRPPTFEQLGKVLRAVLARGKPYHIVHFDGHGMYGKLENLGGPYSRRIFGGAGEKHGCLVFENPAKPEEPALVRGRELGALLSETDVPLLVLNACRSAHAEIGKTPEQTAEANTQSAVQSYGSLAQEVMDQGVAGVVAMRYNVYVVTAAQFVANLYAALAEGASLGEAVGAGRKNLFDQPQRAIAFDPLPLQDWCVPVVYETTPLRLFPRIGVGAQNVGAQYIAPLRVTKPQEQAGDGLPPEPDAGFFGRDETLLALDRAFDRDSIVLLHAYAGQGKTATAAEFARWYAMTGGLDGGMGGAGGGGGAGTAPLLWTSFEQHKPLPRVLDTVGQVFGSLLAQNGIEWPALDDNARTDIALQIFKQIPVLWIWDNVEPVAGFPAGSDTPWSQAEQEALALFLRMAKNTRAKFLLTSRRDEQGWLGTLPTRLTLPAMPMQERVQLADALAQKQNGKLGDVEDWEPLLKFTQGNPLTIAVLVGQALRLALPILDKDPARQKAKRKAKINAFLEQLRQGEAAFDDEVTQGRSKSLGASLAYGFEHTFTAPERRVLALLHFFQGFVEIAVLRVMGTGDWALPELSNLQPSHLPTLLDRAAETGLLTAHGNGYYSIHPALPWYFKTLFDEYYPAALPPASATDTPSSSFILPPSSFAARAFVEALGELGNHYFWQYVGGNREVISLLRAEEANLLFARQLARKNEWWDAVTSTMQGLRSLYGHTGRRAEWQRLVDEITPDFVEAATDGPRPGREEQWGLVTDYRVRLAMEARDWAEAERLQGVSVEWNRRRAAASLALPAEGLEAGAKNGIRSLAVSIEGLGHIQREQGKPECADTYKECIPLYQKIGNQPAESVLVFNLGHAYKNLPALRNLDEAERWYRRSMELFAEGDRKGQSTCYDALGNVAYQKFLEAKKSNATENELLSLLNKALSTYQKALDLTPPDAVNDLAVAHNQMGNIYNDAGDLERALPHYNEAIRYFEAAGDFYHAGVTRRNVAIALANSGRLGDGLLYARAALRDYEKYGNATVKEQEKVKGTMAWIEGLIKSKK